MEVEIVNLTSELVDENDLYNLCSYIVKELKVMHPIFNIIIVNNNKIREINRDYRHIDKETDVISFALEEDSDIIYSDFRLLGDVYISIDKAKSQAMEYGHSLRRELCFLTTHGVLHLLGYDHILEEDRKEMRELEESVLNGYDVQRGT